MNVMKNTSGSTIKRAPKKSKRRKHPKITSGKYAGRRLTCLSMLELVHFRNEVIRGEHHRIWTLLLKKELEYLSTPSGAELDKHLEDIFAQYRHYDEIQIYE